MLSQWRHCFPFSLFSLANVCVCVCVCVCGGGGSLSCMITRYDSGWGVGVQILLPVKIAHLFLSFRHFLKHVK